MTGASVLLLVTGTLVLLQISIAAAAVECTGSHVHGCVLENYLRGPWPDRKPCNVFKVFYPTCESELVDAVAYAVRNKRKVKVTSKNAHSLTKFGCPDDGGVLISTAKYNSTMLLDAENLTATADAGVELGQFVEWLAKQGYALEKTTDWNGVSVSGMISTGSHGSGLFGKGGATPEYVVALRLVIPSVAEQGFAKVIAVTAADQDTELFNAARTSLGVLGAISKVTFTVQPLFKRSVTRKIVDDKSLEDDFLTFARAHEFGELRWYPSIGKVALSIDDRVDITTSGDGRVVQFLPVQASVIRQTRENEERQEATENATAYCTNAQNALTTLVSGYLKDGKTFSGFPVVGFNHKIQTAGGCQYTYENKTNLQLPESERLICFWDYEAHALFWFHTSVSVPLMRVPSFIRDLKHLRAKVPASKLCMIDSYIGFNIRFVKASEAYLGEKDDAAVIEYLTFRDRQAGQPLFFQDVPDEIEQMLLQKYEGKPHFGKNRPAAFDGVPNKVRNISKFLKVREKVDPEGWFSSRWSDAVLGLSGSVVSLVDGCALEGLCICSEDRHCAPDKGYLCQPGVLYKDARVCRKMAAL